MLQGQGSVRPERLQCAAYGGPVIANGDGTVANWLGLHGWQPVRTAGAKRQASGYVQSLHELAGIPSACDGVRVIKLNAYQLLRCGCGSQQHSS